MAGKPANTELLIALRDFIKITMNSKEPGMLFQDESTAGDALLGYLDKMISARVQALLKQTPQRAPHR